ncbi:MAG: flagellar biosynthesis regulator FlaF [Pseudomonadota bacterium]
MPPQAKGYPQSSGNYSRIPAPGQPTYTEAWALVEAARRMAAALEAGPLDQPEVRKALRDSLRLNWRLWTIFQSELSADDCPVPIEIRQNMLSLCNFVDSHTVQTMAEPTPEKVAILIEMNRNIATGLLESLQAAVQAQEEADKAKAPRPAAAGKADEPPPPPTSINAEA